MYRFFYPGNTAKEKDINLFLLLTPDIKDNTYREDSVSDELNFSLNKLNVQSYFILKPYF